MNNIVLLLTIMCLSVGCVHQTVNEQQELREVSAQQLLGSPVYIQVFKEERTLELYVKWQEQYQLVNRYRICYFSGGLGPKYREGDLKSPEGFYSIYPGQLKPDSQFHRAIDIGFPNKYDQSNGYSGHALMIHGACRSTGCYAMTDQYMDEIFRYVQAAFINGQEKIAISIYPFHMTASNMARHRYSSYYNFWRQLQPGYSWFATRLTPPFVRVVNGHYVINDGQPADKPSEYASTGR